MGLVVKVGIFELVADINAKRKTVVSFSDFLTFDKFENLFSVDLVTASNDDSVADFSDENNKTGWSVVVFGVSPNKQDGMHNWNKKLGNIIQLHA